MSCSARHYGLAGAGVFTALIMLMTNLAAPAEPLTLRTDRVIDTLIGVAAGVTAATIIRLFHRGRVWEAPGQSWPSRGWPAS